MNLAREFSRLKRVEWLGLDIREAGSWPLLLKSGLGLLSGVLAFTAMCWFLVMPRVAVHDQAKEQEHILLGEYRVRADRAVHVSGLKTQMETLDERLDALIKMLPGEVDIPLLLSSISKAGLASRLQIDAIRRRPDVAHEFYIERPFDIQVRGDYHRIASFIAALAGLPQIVTQHDFSLEPIPESGVLRLSMAARTYSYVPDEKSSISAGVAHETSDADE